VSHSDSVEGIAVSNVREEGGQGSPIYRYRYVNSGLQRRRGVIYIRRVP